MIPILQQEEELRSDDAEDESQKCDCACEIRIETLPADFLGEKIARDDKAEAEHQAVAINCEGAYFKQARTHELPIFNRRDDFNEFFLGLLFHSYTLGRNVDAEPIDFLAELFHLNIEGAE